MACETLENLLEELDKKLAEERDKSKYRYKGTRKATIKTLMGEVSFSRAIYECSDYEGNETYIYLLDQQLGFDTIGLISTNLAEQIVANASITSYRNATNNVTKY